MKIMQVSHNTELAVRFGSKVRNIIDSPEYKQIFGDVTWKVVLLLILAALPGAERWEGAQPPRVIAYGL